MDAASTHLHGARVARAAQSGVLVKRKKIFSIEYASCRRAASAGAAARHARLTARADVSGYKSALFALQKVQKRKEFQKFMVRHRLAPPRPARSTPHAYHHPAARPYAERVAQRGRDYADAGVLSHHARTAHPAL
jgi:hypothetical protein